MSSSVAYRYSYVDLEAQERRALRAEIAVLRQREAGLRAQALSVTSGEAARITLDGFGGNDATDTRAKMATTAAELRAVAQALRQTVESTQHAVDGLLADAWASCLGRGTGESVSAQDERDATASDGEAQANQAAETAEEAAAQAEGRIAAAVLAAEQLLDREIPRCAQEHLDLFRRRLAEVRAASGVDIARRALADLEQTVRESVVERRRVEDADRVRASLLAHLEDALPEDRERLAAAVSKEREPGRLRAAVNHALSRADKERERAAVARAAASALRDIGCEVGADFVTLLTDSGEAAVPLRGDWRAGYGVLVRLPAGQDRLMTAVVRQPGNSAEADADLTVQQRFCAHGLEPLRRALGAQRILVREELRLEPGRVGVGTAPASIWPTPASRPTVPRP